MMPAFRIARFSLLCLTASALSVLLPRDVRCQEAAACPLEGAWKLVEQKNGDATDYQKQAEGTEEIKYVTGGRFVWVIVQGGKIVAAAGGKYKVDKDKYSETIEYFAGEGQESLVGKTFDFTWKMDGKTWLHVGLIKVNNQDIKIDEKWERCGK
jgi:hypothetical protein